MWPVSALQRRGYILKFVEAVRPHDVDGLGPSNSSSSSRSSRSSTSSSSRVVLGRSCVC